MAAHVGCHLEDGREYLDAGRIIGGVCRAVCVTLRSLLGWLALWVAWSGCASPPPHAVLTVTDPEGWAASATVLAIGTSSDSLRERPLEGLPATVVVRREGVSREVAILVEARDRTGAVLARGGARIHLRRRTQRATVTLAAACERTDVEGASCFVLSEMGFVSDSPEGICLAGRCQTADCGDGYVDLTAGEACDDGNDADDDACVSCAWARCGDGAVWSGVESCDDGNDSSGDGCRDDCGKVEICGDGELDAGEECDDGNDNPNDGCYAVDLAVDPSGCRATRWNVAVVIDGGKSVKDPLALPLYYPESLAVDRNENVYVADARNYVIRRIDAAGGYTSIVAGSGTPGFAGDGGPAGQAEIGALIDIAIDGLGTIYIADGANHRVRRVDPITGVIDTILGTGTAENTGDGGPATSAAIEAPAAIAVDGQGNVFVASSARVRRIGAFDGLVDTYAGGDTPGNSADDIPAATAQLGTQLSIATDKQGALLIADRSADRVRRVDPQTEYIEAVVGSLVGLSDIAIAEDGALFVIVEYGARVLRIDPVSKSQTGVAGTGALSGEYVDGVAALEAPIVAATLAVAPSGALYLAGDYFNRIRRVANGIITAVAGDGRASFGGDGRDARAAVIRYPYALALDPAGRLLISDSTAQRLRRIEADGTIISVAGNGTAADTGDGGPATEASLCETTAVFVTSTGDIYLSDVCNGRVRRIDATTGEIDAFAGGGGRDYGGDGELATNAPLGLPWGLAQASDGDLLITDYAHHVIRRVDAQTRIISTFMGNGSAGSIGDGDPVAAAQLNGPTAVTTDGDGNIFVCDQGNWRIRRIDAETDIVTSYAGTGTAGFDGDGGPAALAQLRRCSGIAVDDAGNLFFADETNHRVRRVDAVTRTIDTVVGNGDAAFYGDGGVGRSAATVPYALVHDGDSTLYLSDLTHGKIRRFDETADVIVGIAGEIWATGDGPVVDGSLKRPWSLLDGSAGTLITDGGEQRLRRIHPDGTRLQTVVGYPGNLVDSQAGPFPYHRLLAEPFGLVEAEGDVLMTERAGHTIRRLQIPDPLSASTWSITTIAGALPRALCCAVDGDPACNSTEQVDAACDDASPGHRDGPIGEALFNQPAGVAYAPSDPFMGRVLYVADSGNHVVRRVRLDDGLVDTIAGSIGTRGVHGASGAASDALFDGPLAVELDGARGLYVADTGNNRVLRIDLDGNTIDRVVGSGFAASSGDGSPASSFSVANPSGLQADRFGNLFVASRATVRRVSAGDDGVARGDDSVDTVYGAPPRDTFPTNVTRCLSGLALADEDDRRLLAIDTCQGIVIELTRSP